MAIVKKDIRQLRRERKRTTWTRFHLPRGQEWPEWINGHSNIYLGPLADVAGCEKVRLGRRVEDPEQTAMIVRECVPGLFVTVTPDWRRLLTYIKTVWESADALKYFQHSSSCGEFLRSLGRENEDGSLLSLQYDCGFCLGEDVGRAGPMICTAA